MECLIIHIVCVHLQPSSALGFREGDKEGEGGVANGLEAVRVWQVSVRVCVLVCVGVCVCVCVLVCVCAYV